MIEMDKPILEMTKEEFRYTQTPLGGPTYKHNVKKAGRPEVVPSKRKLPTDRLKCEICGKEYFRSGSYKHKQTAFHKDRMRMNKKLLELLID